MTNLVTEFEDIAEQLGATLHFSENKINIGGGVISPNCVFLLNLNYKGRTIKIKNATGTYFYGNVQSVILNRQSSLEFQLTTKSHFTNLFSRKKDRFKIQTSSNDIKTFIQTSESILGLRQITQKDVFEPTIIGINSNGKYELLIEYSLQFNDWPEAIIPIVNFYKAFIDKFGD
ncbi:hypothetical protein WNY78_14505 [Psychroserpens sp. AS72]|uniref:hypothetical protein n=1 Tax=Psychroserpens sp. AS72 TaxID=3135775 RepID=UPI00317B90FA